MLTDALIGTRCRVAVNLSHYRGTIVAVNKAQHKVEVKLDRHSSNTDDNNNNNNYNNYTNGDVQEQLVQNVDGEEMTELPSIQHPFTNYNVTVTASPAPHNENANNVNMKNTNTTTNTENNRKVQLMSELRNGKVFTELDNNAIFNDSLNVNNYYYNRDVEANAIDHNTAEACYSPMSLSSLSSSPSNEAIYNNLTQNINKKKTEIDGKCELYASQESTNAEFGSIRERYLNSLQKQEVPLQEELIREQQKAYGEIESDAANFDLSQNSGISETIKLRNANGKAVNTDRSANAPNSSSKTHKYKSFHETTSIPFTTSNNSGGNVGGSGGCAMYGLDDEVIKTFDSSAISVRSDRGCCHVHLNGLQCCVFNSTGKYRDLNVPDGPNRDGKSNRYNANNNRNNNTTNGNQPHYTNINYNNNNNNNNYSPHSEFELNSTLQSPSAMEGNEQVNENSGN